MSGIKDRYYEPGWCAPAIDCFPVTPSDSVDQPSECRGLYIGGAGNVAIMTPAGNIATFVGLPVAYQLNAFIKRVMVTNTTATNIVGLL